MFSNKLENHVFQIVKNNVTNTVNFSNSDNVDYYISNRKIFKSNKELTLFTNVPKNYGQRTTTEIVLFGAGFDIRIDCKYQKSSGNIQYDSILGEIDRNVINNKLIEKKLMFVVNGKGIPSNSIGKLKRKVKKLNVDIMTLDEFKFYFEKVAYFM